MVVELCDYTKDYWITHIRSVNCMTQELYLNKASLLPTNQQTNNTWATNGGS